MQKQLFHPLANHFLTQNKNKTPFQKIKRPKGKIKTPFEKIERPKEFLGTAFRQRAEIGI